MEVLDREVDHLTELKRDEALVPEQVGTVGADLARHLEGIDVCRQARARRQRRPTPCAIEREADDLGVVERRPMSEDGGDALSAENFCHSRCVLL